MSETNNNTNNILTCVCPHCKESVRIRRPQKPGRYKFTCTSCSTPFAITFNDETQEEASSKVQEGKENTPLSDVIKVHKNKDQYTTIGGLVEKHRGFFGNDKIHPLHLGTQIIGRNDQVNPSDISLNDNTVSRQSIELMVEQHNSEMGMTYSYSLKVRRLKNPVLHNGIPLQKGEEIVLHIGDMITLGKTKLILR